MYIDGMLQDGINGTLSSKRVITLAAFLLCAVAFIANLFFGMKIEQFIFDSMSYIAMAGLGVTVAEKFASKPSYQNEQVQQNYYQVPQPQQYNPPYPRRGTPLPRQEDPLI